MNGVNQTGNGKRPSFSGTPKASPARHAALQALQQFRRQGNAEPARCEREDDSRLAERLFFGVLQNERFLDTCITRYLSAAKPHPSVMDLLRLGAYQILFLDRVPDSAAVNDAVTSCRASKQRYAAGMVNAVLRKISAEKVLLLKTDESTDLALRYSHPEWLVERLLREHEPDFVRGFLESNQETPALCLQINTLRTTPEAFDALLRQKGIVPLSAREDFPSVTIPSRRVDTLPGYDEGLFFVQDNAARASVKIIGLKPGMRVLDACAAPGGKSMAAALEGADVLSCDVNISRLNRCTENYRRLGMDISTRQMDASTFCTDWSEAFDVVIADLCLHYFLKTDTEKILNDIRRILTPGGHLILRVNSINDVLHGAGQGPEIEHHVFEMEGKTIKRFFNEEDIRSFFKDFTIEYLKEEIMTRYKLEKRLYRVCVKKE